METVVNTPAQTRDEGSGLGIAIALVILGILLFLLFFYGLPLVRQSTGGPQINVPGEVDINLKQEGR